MAATTTKVGICNLALTELRGNPISNFDSDLSTEAKLCRAHYEHVREVVLEAKEWRFATRRLKLAAHVDTPAYGYKYQFKLPSDCLRVLSASDKPNGKPEEDNNIDWEREEDFLMANTKVVYIRYTQNLAITTKFSPGFVQAMAVRLGAQMAVALTGSTKRRDQLLKDYDYMVSTGATKDGMQGKAKKRRPGRLELARRGGGNYYMT
mgnify:CR=1 FL=1